MEKSPAPTNKSILISCGILALVIFLMLGFSIAAGVLYLTLAR